jgi:DnaD/phage-associated family protein
MKTFGGFRESETFTSMPDTLFGELLPALVGVEELKVVLHAVWSIAHMEGTLRAMTEQDFATASLGLSPERVRLGLEQAVAKGVLLRAGDGARVRYLLNSPGGRAAAAALAAGTLESAGIGASAPLERPNIFRIYEENIGPLTPLLADALRDAQDSYPGVWIEEAIALAATHNKRSWSYCEAILRRWKEEGRGKKQDRRDDQAARQRDVEEKIRKFLRG